MVQSGWTGFLFGKRQDWKKSIESSGTWLDVPTVFSGFFFLPVLEIHPLFLIPWRTSVHSHQGGSWQAPSHQIQIPSKVSAGAGLRHESFEISGGKIWQMVPQQFWFHTGIFGFVRLKLINLGLKNLLWHFGERRTKSYKKSVIKPILFCWFPCKTRLYLSCLVLSWRRYRALGKSQANYRGDCTGSYHPPILVTPC